MGGERVWQKVRELSPEAYQPHPLHDRACDWPETSCYVDALIEVLHGLGLPVEACLAFTLRADLTSGFDDMAEAWDTGMIWLSDQLRT